MIRRPPRSPLFPYTPLFRSARRRLAQLVDPRRRRVAVLARLDGADRRLLHVVRRREIGLADAEADDVPALARERRSEEHTSELQSPCNLVCRLLLEKKKKQH